jgi:hypothetical protein
MKNMQQQHRERVGELQNEIASLRSRNSELESSMMDIKELYESSDKDLRQKIVSQNSELLEMEAYALKW